MGDKDSKLIFEAYNKNILNEVAPVVAGVAGVAALIAPIMSILSTEYGWTRTLMEFVKKEFGIDLDELSDSAYAPFVRFFDPSGLSSWISLQKAHEEYLKDPNSWEKNSEWWSQWFGTIPVWGKLIKLISAAFRGVIAFKFFRKILYYISANKKFKSLLFVGFKKYFENFEKFNAPMTEAKIKPIIEIAATLLVGFYGRGALEIVAEMRLPTLADKFLRFAIEERLSNIDDNPPSEKEVEEGLVAKPSGTPAPTSAITPKPYSISKDNDNEPVKGKDGSIIPIGGTFEVNGVTYIVTR